MAMAKGKVGTGTMRTVASDPHNANPWAALVAALSFVAILPAMKKPREVLQPRWRVFLLKRKAERLPFTVTAPNAEEAIERAIEEHDIPERVRFRISVQREA
jgi:hypothetical protein